MVDQSRNVLLLPCNELVIGGNYRDIVLSIKTAPYVYRRVQCALSILCCEICAPGVFTTLSTTCHACEYLRTHQNTMKGHTPSITQCGCKHLNASQGKGRANTQSFVQIIGLSRSSWYSTSTKHLTCIKTSKGLLVPIELKGLIDNRDK